MKALLVPDIHLGKGTSIGKDPVGVGLNSRIEDQKNLLNFITEYVKKNKIDYINKIEYVFVMGDIWENVNPKSLVVKVFFEWIKSLTDLECLVVIIVGNHDYIRSGQDKVSMLDSLDVLRVGNCMVVKEPTFMACFGIDLLLLPYTDRKQLEKNTHNEAVDYLKKRLHKIKEEETKHFTNKNQVSMVLGHLCLEGSLWVGDEIDEDANEIFCPLSMFDGFDQVWMGHVHKPQILKNDGKQVIGHVGSLDKTAFTGPDSTEKSMVLLEWNQVKTTKIEHTLIPLPCRPLVPIEIDIPVDCKDVDEFLYDEISKQDVTDAIVRVTIKLGSHDSDSVDKNKIINLLKRKNAFHICSYKEHKPVKKVIVKNANIDETIKPEDGVKIMINTLDAEDDFKKDLFIICKDIIKEVSDSSK